MSAVFITGISSGIGLALAEKYLNEGAKVYGFSRRKCPLSHKNLYAVQADLLDTPNIPGIMFELLMGVKKIDVVVLNAGVLGDIACMKDVPLQDLKKAMDINVWGNKIVLDWLFKHVEFVDQVIAISSGAAVNGSKGWNGYSISKAALNMMIALYAAEKPDTHFIAFAPGLVDTAMQEYLCSKSDVEEFPSLARIQSSRGTADMPSPVELAERLPGVFESLRKRPSGSFVDIRKMV